MSAAWTQPVVYEQADLEALLQHLLSQQVVSSTLVVCSSKDSFSQELRHATHQRKGSDLEDDDAEEIEHQLDSDSQPVDHEELPPEWKTPTLRLLASSRTLQVVFCPDLAHLRAYLATYPARELQQKSKSQTPSASTCGTARILAILNLIQVHRPTTDFSAQGLNRTFSLAIEAAYTSGSRLIFAECSSSSPSFDQTFVDDEMAESKNKSSGDPWDEEVSILNVTTKSFGVGDRGWVGRTVSIRQIAGRWCAFKSLPVPEI